MPIFQKINQLVNDPKMTFHPISVEVTSVTLPKDHCIQVHDPIKIHHSMQIEWLFFKNFDQKVSDPNNS